MKKYVYSFHEGDANMRELLGGKGANLAEMTGLGFPVPKGFTVTTEACTRYYDDGEILGDDIFDQVKAALTALEKETGKAFGSTEKPLLVSVRSGARASMPGMMDTVLNLGMNDDVVLAMAELTKNPRFAYDSYRRFIMMFSDVVMGLDRGLFDAAFEAEKARLGVELDTDVDEKSMRFLVDEFKAIYQREQNEPFPQAPIDQLKAAVRAVFRSWNTERAIVYRRMNNIPASWGTAVNVQEMVFGNTGDTSGTGVAFTRNPSTGERKLYGEFLLNAQGEDVVAGIRTPQPIEALERLMPDVFKQFNAIAEKLEKHYKDMQDMEFTIEQGKLFMLQTRNGKRTAQAAVKIAVDLVNEGLIEQREALMKIEPGQLDSLLHPTFDETALKSGEVIGKGLPASPGAAHGAVYFSYERAKVAKDRGENIILVRLETSPEDIQGMYLSEGILTGRGGMTSHAAVVARGMGKCCVSGCSDIQIYEAEGYLLTASGDTIREGEHISLNGSTGLVYRGDIPTAEASISGDFDTIMQWADEVRTLTVRTNADAPGDVQDAIRMGAEGVGLCRTEHMFFEKDRIFNFRMMILADDEAKRREALALLLPYQQSDFEGIFRAVAGKPVTIRLLDPPLHEFLPTKAEDIGSLAARTGHTIEEVKARIHQLHELNPMLGCRGCRLLIRYPEIAQMQTQAIIQAAIAVKKEGLAVYPEVMIPLVGEVKELKALRKVITTLADQLIEEAGISLDYTVGTMMEIPRACLLADDIAESADFFSMGTNDLTQMTYGLSRDDAGPILEKYYSTQIYENDPTATLDQTGVGQLVSQAVEKGRQTKADLKVGVCGEHGGDPLSIEFFHRTGLNYVSCSPYRVPIARLAAAQAEIKYPR